MTSTTTPLKVGILGVANIAHKIALTIAHPESRSEIRAVASRGEEKAKKYVNEFFADESTVTIFSGNDAYDQLLESDLIDAVYIPLPTAVKKSWVLKALNAGKHVVVEKPVALSSADYEEFLQAARANNKFILDGTMFPHHPRTRKMLDLVGGMGIGDVSRVQCTFSLLTDDDWLQNSSRTSKSGDPYGCIGDLGWYCIRFALLVYEKLGYAPVSVQVVDVQMNAEQVPLDATCVVRFEEGRSLWFHCGFKTTFRQRFEIYGDKKILGIEDLVLPTKPPSIFTLTSTELTEHHVLTIPIKETVESNGDLPHEVLLWQTFSRLARGMDEPGVSWESDGPIATEAKSWASMSMTTQKVLDALIKSAKEGCVVINL